MGVKSELPVLSYVCLVDIHLKFQRSLLICCCLTYDLKIQWYPPMICVSNDTVSVFQLKRRAYWILIHLHAVGTYTVKKRRVIKNLKTDS